MSTQGIQIVSDLNCVEIREVEFFAFLLYKSAFHGIVLQKNTSKSSSGKMSAEEGIIGLFKLFLFWEGVCKIYMCYYTDRRLFIVKVFFVRFRAEVRGIFLSLCLFWMIIRLLRDVLCHDNVWLLHQDDLWLVKWPYKREKLALTKMRVGTKAIA